MIQVQRGDMTEPLPYADETFTAVLSDPQTCYLKIVPFVLDAIQ